jgi:2-dehydropantoate 2-reductase
MKTRQLMKILIFGSGVIGTTYGWQLSKAGQDVTLYVRAGKKAAYQDGIQIKCRDERGKQVQQVETLFRPKVVDTLSPDDGYDLILVCVKSNQLESVLPQLAQNAGKSDILFFQNNWWGSEKIGTYLTPGQYFFGFSRLVGGWRNGSAVECIIFNSPMMSSMLGEVNGKMTPRIKQVESIFKKAGLKPEISPDILSWLKFHYIEYLGATGAILKAGSAETFASQADLVRESILATREALQVCQERGIPIKAAPFNLRLYNLPLGWITWLGQKQYQAENIQRFFEENIRNGLSEIAAQYQDVVSEGQRLDVEMPILTGLGSYFQTR